MKISYHWIQETVDLSDALSYQSLGEALTNSGIPVEVFEPLTPGVSGVVVAKILKAEKHPNADKLKVCQVDVGLAEPLQIVCGAANAAEGICVPCAMIGASVVDRHTGEKFSIKKSKLRGVESHGMLCSADELGLDTKLLPKGSAEGLWILPEDAPVGQDLVQYLQLDDVSMELELTPNRSDCLSLRGIAHEIAAVLQVKNRFYENSQAQAPDPSRPNGSLQVKINSDACTRYHAQVIEQVQVGASPLWLQLRLAAHGIRSINNVVDVTNLVMLEWGQPLHAFDLERIEGNLLQARYAEEGESIVTLDGQERKLQPGMQVIADARKAVAIAGVMGGENSEVTGSTTRVVLESASFDPGVTRRTGKALGLSSEAQKRFEKGVDPTAVQQALDRASALICALAGGAIKEGPVHVQTVQQEELVLDLDCGRLNRVLGTEITEAEAAAILERLDFRLMQADRPGLIRVEVPLRRPDIQVEEDLYEEIARIYGYDAIPSTLPFGGITQGALTAEQALRRKLRHLGAALGLQEVWTYTFTHPAWLNDLKVDASHTLRNQIRLMSPLSDERQVLRTTLLPSLVEIVQSNDRRKQADVALFEVGKIYLPDAGGAESSLPEEPYVLGIAMRGRFGYGGPLAPLQPVDFFTIKGVVEQILDRIGIEHLNFEPLDLPWMHPGRSARILQGDVEIGYLGALHPEAAEKWEVSGTYYAELNVQELIRLAQQNLHVKPLPVYPASERDLAVLADRKTAVGHMLELIRQSGGDILESVSLFDVYEGAQVPAGKKSVAFSLIYRHPDRTLTDQEVADAQNQIMQKLSEQYGAELRQ